jgi:hypothetical protein
MTRTTDKIKLNICLAGQTLITESFQRKTFITEDFSLGQILLNLVRYRPIVLSVEDHSFINMLRGGDTVIACELSTLPTVRWARRPVELAHVRPTMLKSPHCHF